MTAKDDLHHYLRGARGALLWKLDGLSEYDVRRPLTPTGTNLLGLAKHLSGIEFLYFGFVFGRDVEDPPAWHGEHVAPGTDLWATAEESREYIIATYQRAGRHADATIEALDLEATGFVPWWPGEHVHPTLHRVLVHVIAEVQRHLGHADIVRELVDGSTGSHAHNALLESEDASYWADHHEKLLEIAKSV